MPSQTAVSDDFLIKQLGLLFLAFARHYMVAITIGLKDCRRYLENY